MPTAPVVDVLPVRAFLIGATSLGMATAAHAFAGGGAPRGLLAGAVLVASVVPVAVALARFALTVPRLVPVLGLLQVLLHTELSVLAGHGSHVASSAGALGGHAAHGLDPGVLAQTLSADAAAASVGVGAGHGSGGLLMFAAHAVAVSLIAVVLASGDRAARWVVAWMSAVRLLVRRAVTPQPLRRPGAVVVDQLAGARALDRLLCGGLRFRGPPTASCRADAFAVGAA